MANFFETSFVPQQPLVKVQVGMGRREPVNVALVTALIIFFVVVSIAGGMYFWEKNTEKKVATAGQELAAKEKNFDIDKINSYKTLQTTLRSAKTLVDQHTIFSVLLDSIEANAAQNIGLTSLGFSAAGNGSTLTLTGQAPSYKALYFQVEKWRGMKPIFQSAEVTSMSLGENTGIVNFSVKIIIDTRSLDFSSYLAAAASHTLSSLNPVTASTSLIISSNSDKPDTSDIKSTSTKK